MWRFIRALIAKFTGIFSSAADNMQEDPHVMGQTYDNSINKKTESFETVKNAVGTLIGMKKKKVDEIKELSERIDKLSRIKTAAKAKMKNRAEAIVAECKSQGITDKAQVQAKLTSDPEYLKHHEAFTDNSSSLASAEKESDRKEAELADMEKKIATHKAQLQSMQRGIKELQEEKHDAIADTVLAKEMDAVNSVLAGVTNDQEDKDLLAARQARQRAVGRSEITSELVGNDAALAEQEYLDYSNTIESNEELNSLIDLDSMLGNDEENLDPAKLPEQ